MKEQKTKILPVILCGGSGTRLWPSSRASFPKQFINGLSKDKKSLLQETILRIAGIENIEDPIFICNEDHRFLVAEQMREINIKPKSIILEPFAKSTCPAIALAALKASEEKEDPILLVLSSDHIIKENAKFLKSINNSIEIAAKGKLATFGVVPTAPETCYGYIEAGELLLEDFDLFKIKKFVEKPNFKLAKKLYQDKNFTWNSGMFTFKTSVILSEINKFEPEVLNICEESLKNGFKDLDFQRIDRNIFEGCKEISFDVSIMEKTNIGVVIPLDATWSDVGNWKSLWENEDKDKNGNVLSGNVITYDVNQSILKSQNRLLIGNGLKNMVVIETDDAILVSDKEKSQNIKNIVKDLISKGYVEGKENRINYRPWGNYKSIAEDSRWQVKKIEVKPGAQLSLQMHHHRAEHWIIVKGTAKVTIDDKQSIIKENESVFIPLGSKHRLSNPENVPLVLIEVQSGSYLGEDDIVRFKDDYGRS